MHCCCQIVHKDIKPDNILIDQNDNVKLADFGISEIIETSGIVKKKNGTNLFLPPEIFSESKVHAKGIDIWSMGITLYMLVHGYLPFKNPHFQTKVISNK